MSKIDRTIAIASALLATASLIYAQLAIDASWEIAKVTGSLEKADYAVTLGALPLIPEKSTKIVIGASHVAAQSGPAIGAIPFGFTSSGKKSVEGLTATFLYHSMLKRGLLERLELKRTGGVGVTEIDHTYSENERQSFASYRVPTLNPGTSLGISEPIFLQETSFRMEVDAKTKDGVQVSVPVQASFEIQSSLNVSAKDSSQRTFPISYSIFKVDSMRDLKSGPAIDLAINEQRGLRKRLGFFKYAAALLSKPQTGRFFLVYVPTQEVRAGDAVVYATTGQQEVSVATYSLLAWRLLFNSAN